MSVQTQVMVHVTIHSSDRVNVPVLLHYLHNVTIWLLNCCNFEMMHYRLYNYHRLPIGNHA